jgi:membrane-anchored mycosin MYCP
VTVVVGDNFNVEGGPYPYEPADLIVGLANLGLVVNKLEDLQIRFSPPDKSEQLGLARIVLTSDKSAAESVVRSVSTNDAALQRVASHDKPVDTDPIGQVLWGLRGLFAAEHAGFMPTLGKNRIVGRVHGVGKVSHGGGSDPVSASAADSPLLTTRAAGPGSGVRVGVLDTKLFPQSWLAGGWSAQFSDTDYDPGDALYAQGHATFVTGLVLTQAPGATAQVRAVLGPDGRADSWQVAKEIVELGRSGIHVLNLSFLCYSEDNQPPLVLSAAVDRIDPDVVIVAAAGNHGALPDSEGNPRTDDQTRKPAWPAALDDVVAVGAADEHGDRADFSPDAPWVDLLAPGVLVLSTYLPRAKPSRSAGIVEFGGFARWSGTSFAAALVSGAIAAGTDPGRVSSRDALQNILTSEQVKRSRPQAQTELTGQSARPAPDAPYVKLRTF